MGNRTAIVTRRVTRICIAAALLALAAASEPHDAPTASQFSAELSMAPFTLANRSDVLGRGEVRATVEGGTLTISGTYSDLASDATFAHVNAAGAMGVPGRSIGRLAVTGGRRGRVSGVLRLGRSAMAALRAGGVSVVIDSVRAPEGNVWGWFMPVGAQPIDMFP